MYLQCPASSPGAKIQLSGDESSGLFIVSVKAEPSISET